MEQAEKKRSSVHDVSALAAPFRVQYHDGAQTAAARLPMMAAPDVPYQKDWAGFWALPTCRSYGDGCAAGHAAAVAYLKFLAHNGCPNQFGGLLQHLVLGLFARLSSATSEEERDGLHGQVVGFFTHIEGYAAEGASSGRWHLFGVTEDQICRDLQDAIDGGPDARYLERLAKARSEAARRAAQARWSKRAQARG